MSNLNANDPNLIMSPLADPVTSAIFANVETAGEAAGSIIRATLKASGDNELLGKIVEVTPQRTHTSPKERGCRVDVDTKSDANENVIFEIQLNPDMHIITRDLFSAAHIFTKTSTRGDTSAQMALKMPRVIYINILGYNIREDNSALVQPFKIMYTNPPSRVAVHHFSGYNIQLPRILEMPPNFEDSLYCWCYTLYTAHLKGITIQEVLAVQPALQTYSEQDMGFSQFCDRYNQVCADPATRDEYVRWTIDQMRQEGERAWIRQEAITEGRIEIAINMIHDGDDVHKISRITGLESSRIFELKNELKASG
ncbi:MAG: PD-(D/E)XK nuclease family transposase [Defluviitaleaceae bacterium]|nr:PD-(D/E)XK nuclease family transposase [Defluviitaleaceae bacterium]